MKTLAPLVENSHYQGMNTEHRLIHRAMLLLLLLVLATGPLLADDNRRLRVVTEAWPPLVEEKDGKPSGVLWERASRALAQMGYEMELEFVPWNRAKRLVARGERDAILGISFSPERADEYGYPNEPLYFSETSVFARTDNPVSFDDVESLTGLTVGVSPGYFYSDAIERAVNFQRFEVPSIRSGLRMVALGRIDAMLANRDVAWFEADLLGIGDSLSASNQPVSSDHVYLAFRESFSRSMLNDFARALVKVKASESAITETGSSITTVPED